MDLRVRGSGASADNGQALIFYLRGIRMNARARPSAEYAIQPTDVIAGKSEEGTTVAAPRALALARWALSRYHPFVVRIDGNGAAAGAVWREVHNVYDILFDDDEDRNESNPLGSKVLLAAGRPSTDEPPAPVAPRVMLPVAFVPLNALRSLGLDEQQSASDISGEISVLCADLPGDGSASDGMPVSMRRAITLISYAAYRYAAAVEPSGNTAIRLVLPDAAIDSGYAAVLTVVWAVAVRGYFNPKEPFSTDAKNRDMAAGDVNCLAKDLEQRRLTIVSVSEAFGPNPAAATTSGGLFISPSGSSAAWITARLQGASNLVVDDATWWLEGRVPSSRVFDVSAATLAALNENKRENFCPCCSSCNHAEG
jgi:hypothetical protein